jgi:hypothetical protein
MTKQESQDAKIGSPKIVTIPNKIHSSESTGALISTVLNEYSYSESVDSPMSSRRYSPQNTPELGALGADTPSTVYQDLHNNSNMDSYSNLFPDSPLFDNDKSLSERQHSPLNTIIMESSTDSGFQQNMIMAEPISRNISMSPQQYFPPNTPDVDLYGAETPITDNQSIYPGFNDEPYISSPHNLFPDSSLKIRNQDGFLNYHPSFNFSDDNQGLRDAENEAAIARLKLETIEANSLAKKLEQDDKVRVLLARKQMKDAGVPDAEIDRMFPLVFSL